MSGWLKAVLAAGLIGTLLVGGVAFGLPQLMAPANPRTGEDQKSNLEGVVDKLRQAQRDLRNGRARVTLTEEEIGSYLGERLREATRRSPTPVTGLTVALAPGRVSLELALRPNGRDVGLRISGRPEVRGKDLLVYIDRVGLGNVPLPLEMALNMFGGRGSLPEGLEIDTRARTLTVDMSIFKYGQRSVMPDTIRIEQGRITLDLVSR